MNIGVLEYGGNGLAVKLRDFLYKDCTVFMQRKFDIVRDVDTVKRIDVTKEELLEMLKRLGTQKAIANELGCSRPNVSRLFKGFEI